ncbi:hypothetical protein [Actinoalloteichus hymeniacidonis]|uniref:Septum formation initiator n=1 Tax=Actinoalloteichus hymeniacidonis TaxID=340345 RepID=A0AAC9HNJ4_9PSEU|nr:hypothetical protein [Actinoalloteichus hymeniacidonis]AOS62557.1 hypothetical protein TL08_08710 [Actinoalloteichus hymeniacidonis]MBB5909412.1 hypothetical protein [Actinoalloteichus hymeniacidonis]
MSGEKPVRGKTALGVVGWAVAAVVATTVGVAALSAIGAGITDSVVRPLSQDEVEGRIAAADATASAEENRPDPNEPDSTPSPPPDPQGDGPPATGGPAPSEEPDQSGGQAEEGQNQPDQGGAVSPELIETPGGMVTARCAQGRVEVLSASPAQAFGVDVDNEDGDDDEPPGVTVQFESDEDEIEVHLSCADSVLSHRVSYDD